MLLLRLLRVMSIFAMAALTACGGGSGGSDPQAPRMVTVQGSVVNGPISGATVAIYAPSGILLGTAETAADGSFSIALTNPPQYLRLISEGGQLEGAPYYASLSADCVLAPSASMLDCSLTPFSSLRARLVDAHGKTPEEAAQVLENLFRLGGDPFILDSGPSGPVPQYKFDLAAARAAIANGTGLTAWIDDLAPWVLDPFVGTAPPGTPVYQIRAVLAVGSGKINGEELAGANNSIEVTVAMGDKAEFLLEPGENRVISSVSGCGGSRTGSLYTTAPITGVGASGGPCVVQVAFGLQKFTVEYLAEEGGAISGLAVQLIEFGNSSTEVTATPLTGYDFTGWLDGIETASRSDGNITSDRVFTAQFEKKQFTLRYAPSDNGFLRINGTDYIGTDVFEQQVLFDESGPAVEAIANLGYRFAGWSDIPEKSNPRTDNSVRAAVNAIALFEPKPESTPWLQVMHTGDIEVRVIGPTQVQVNWTAEVDSHYDLYISPVANMVLEEYALSGGELLLDVQPPLVLENLDPGEPVYLALKKNDEALPLGITSVVPGPWGVDGVVHTQAIDEDGTRFVGGDFLRPLQYRRAAIALPAAVAEISTPPHALAFPEVDGVINAVISDNNGGWYIGGRFNQVGGLPRQNLAHIDASGTVTDRALFVSGADAEVLALRTISSVLLVGGVFDQAGDDENSEVRYNVAAFVGGELLSDWSPQVVGPVFAIGYSMEAELIYLGGDITAVGAQARSGLAAVRFDNGQATSWQPAVNGRVTAIDVHGGQVVVAGNFASVLESNVPRAGLAVFNAEGGLLAFDPQFQAAGDLQVNDLLVTEDMLFVGGNFHTATGLPVAGIAGFQLNGTLSDYSVGVQGGAVSSLALSDGVLYVAGDFNSAFDSVENVRARHGVAAFSHSGVLLDWNPSIVGMPKMVAVSGREFDSVQVPAVPVVVGEIRGLSSGLSRQSLMALDVNGNLLEGFPEFDGAVLSLSVGDAAVYAGGLFDVAEHGSDTTLRERIAAFDRLSGELLGWNPGVSGGDVYALSFWNEVLYVGGDFSATGLISGEQPRLGLAAYNVLGDVLSWSPSVNGAVYSVAIDSGVIYVGGDFSEADDGFTVEPRNNLTAFDVNGDLLSWNAGADGKVFALSLLGGNVYAGGDFSLANGDPRSNLAAFDSAGALLSWNPGADAQVLSLSSDDGLIYAAGDFSVVGQSAEGRVGIAAFEESGALAPWYPAEVEAARHVAVRDGFIGVGGGFINVLDPTASVLYNRSGLVLFNEDGALLDR